MNPLHRRPLPACLTAALLMVLIGCNTRQELFGSPEAVTPTGPALPTPAPAVLRVGVEPRAVVGGAPGVGTVVLSLPAGPSGVIVSLSSDDGRVAVPPEVLVPAGAESAIFSLTTQPTSQDGSANVAASTPNRTVLASLLLWASLPTSLSLVSDAGEVLLQGRTERFVRPTASFRVRRCFDTELEITADRGGVDWFSTWFGAPRGTPLRVGEYENATHPVFREPGTPGIEVAGRGRACGPISGRFTVHELQWSGPSSIARFWATFEQRCGGREPALRGDVRVVNQPILGDVGICWR